MTLDFVAAVHHRAGLGRYAEGLARELLSLLGDRLAFFYNKEQGIAPPAGWTCARTVSLGYKPWRMLVWLGMPDVGFNRLTPDAERFHATEHLLLPLRGRPATAPTVHDLIFRRYPQHHKPLRRYLNVTLPLFCRRGTRIIAVSEQSKRDVVAAYGIPPQKITVIYEVADTPFVHNRLKRLPRRADAIISPERYLLFVGTIEPRKPGTPVAGLRASARREADRCAGDRRQARVGSTTTSSPSGGLSRP